MFNKNTVDNAYNLASQLNKIEVNNGTLPDKFYFTNDPSYIFEYTEENEEKLEQYLTASFVNYWKRGIEKELQKHNKLVSPEIVKQEMCRSLDAMNIFGIRMLTSQGNGLNLNRLMTSKLTSMEISCLQAPSMYKNATFGQLPYANWTLETFCSNPNRLRAFYRQLSKDSNSKSMIIYSTMDNESNLTFKIGDISDNITDNQFLQNTTLDEWAK